MQIVIVETQLFKKVNNHHLFCRFCEENEGEQEDEMQDVTNWISVHFIDWIFNIFQSFCIRTAVIFCIEVVIFKIGHEKDRRKLEIPRQSQLILKISVLCTIGVQILEMGPLCGLCSTLSKYGLKLFFVPNVNSRHVRIPATHREQYFNVHKLSLLRLNCI